MALNPAVNLLEDRAVKRRLAAAAVIYVAAIAALAALGWSCCG